MKSGANFDMMKGQLLNALFQLLGTDPAGQEAQFYYNSTDKSLKLHNGTTWLKILNSASVGIANGIAGLDSGGKVPVAQLPAAVVGGLNYQGTLDASPGTPPGSPAKGYFWIISVAGTINSVPYAVKDWIVYNGTSFDKVDNTDAVVSVAGKTGIVTLTVADISDYVAYSHPTGDGNMHVPANGTANAGKLLQATGTAGVYQWVTITGGGTVNKYSTTIGNGVLTSMTVAHNLNTRAVVVCVFETASPYQEVLCDVEHTDLNTITIKTANAPTSGQYTVVVMGS